MLQQISPAFEQREQSFHPFRSGSSKQESGSRYGQSIILATVASMHGKRLRTGVSKTLIRHCLLSEVIILLQVCRSLDLACRLLQLQLHSTLDGLSELRLRKSHQGYVQFPRPCVRQLKVDP